MYVPWAPPADRLMVVCPGAATAAVRHPADGRLATSAGAVDADGLGVAVAVGEAAFVGALDEVPALELLQAAASTSADPADTAHRIGLIDAPPA